jgi:hypothetical protein
MLEAMNAMHSGGVVAPGRAPAQVSVTVGTLVGIGGVRELARMLDQELHNLSRSG